MPKPHNPRRGSMQFWPRKRSRHSLVRVRSWAPENQAKPLGFIGYKAGMTHVMVTDNRPKSLTKGDKISMPVSIVECPPMTVVGVAFYNKSKKITSILAEKFDKNVSRTLTLPKKPGKKIDDVQDFDSIRILVHSNPSKTGFGTKKPKLLEMALGGNKDDQLAYAKEHLGKEISVADVFAAGNQVDVHGVTKGKGFQGTVKRYGVPIKQHKGEKNKRGIGNLGAWTPKRVDYRVAQPGKMGYHLRTEYNKHIIKIGEDGKEVTRIGGLQKYGVVKNTFVLVKGSVAGSKKRALVLTKAIRSNYKITKDAPEVAFVSI
ncbi:50S ribosomal protein L3 [Candidatus Woesearchaeota archaeon]|jgi:large subunit ribosomal protein L3|nr:50S ribosomal protein L3 [Candidatus Woesearchaeota archaeon]MBT4151269.1 50S ribosomal protein L3 [Candidatus Woesearchaeota archaeon]MBT4247043.1 50S ribosomal protein L3 [Candidatus Woesearchaeota archaeon]MBT4433971.1 50S ribosomal protein L3 [Candidatus Woesearchaeota archaeon]MBT7332368.1 50S ribosomal protein L3 [Candidatus Woesearchaeota archaeon]